MAPVDLVSSVVTTSTAQTHPIGTPQSSVRAPVLQVHTATSVPQAMSIPSMSPWVMKTLGR